MNSSFCVAFIPMRNNYNYVTKLRLLNITQITDLCQPNNMQSVW